MITEIRAPKKWASVTASDTVDIPLGTIKAIRANGSGDIAAVGEDDNVEVFTVAAGETLVMNPKRINSTNTTATGLVALYD